MGAENSKDDESTEQGEAEETVGPKKDIQPELPNGDVGRSPERLDGIPDGETSAELPKDSPEVDEYTKRMTIIGENMYHYVGIVSGREYAREKGLTPPTEGKLPTAPKGFLQPDKEKNDAKASHTKTVGKFPDEKPDSSEMELPRFYQSSNEDKNKATEKSGKFDSANLSKGKMSDGKTQEKYGKERLDNMEGKPKTEGDSSEMNLHSFHQSQKPDKDSAVGESGESPELSTSKTDSKIQEKDEKQRKVESKPEKDDASSNVKRSLLNQSEKQKTTGEPNRSELRSGPKGVGNGKTEDHNDKGLECKPEKDTDTPSVELPRSYQAPGEDKKKAIGKSGNSESQDVSNGNAEGKMQEKDVKMKDVKKTESKAEKEVDSPTMDLPRVYQSDKSKTATKSVQSEVRDLSNSEIKNKAEQKSEKLKSKANKEHGSQKMELSRFYSPGITGCKTDGISEITPSAEKDAASESTSKPEVNSEFAPKRYTIAMTVGPRRRKTEQPKRKNFAVENRVAVGNAKNEEDKTKPVEANVEERTVPNKGESSHRQDILESEESSNESEPTDTQLKAAEKKEKSVRFEDSIDESPSPPKERKRILSMIYVAPGRDRRIIDESTVNNAPLESTLTPPPSPTESRARNEAASYDDRNLMDEEEVKRTNKRMQLVDLSVDEDNNACTTPVQEKKQLQLSDASDITNGSKSPPKKSDYDNPGAGNDMKVTAKGCSNLYSLNPPRQSPRQRIQEVEEGVPDYDVHHLKQPAPRSPEVDLGSGKILNAPSILMGSSITSSTNRQMCELLPQETPANHVDSRVSSLKIKLAPKEIRTKTSRIAVKLHTGSVSPGDSGGKETALLSGGVQSSTEPLAVCQSSGRNSTCDSYTQTPDVLCKDQPTGARFARSRSVGFQCKASVPEKSTATHTRSSLPSAARLAGPPEVEKKTKIPQASRSARPEARLSKSSPLPESRTNLARKVTSTSTGSPKTAATSDYRNAKEPVKSRPVPVEKSHGCSGHLVTSKVAESPRNVRKKDDNKSPLHKTSKSMESIPRCTCLQLTGKDPTPEKKKLSRQPSSPLGLREYNFTPPSNKPHWR